MFVQYINTFLKLKAEASGYPTWDRTPDDEGSFVQSFNDGEGILLNKDAIRPNAAKRSLAKLCLNSMWGKLTERSNRTRVRAIPRIEVMCLIFASNDVVWLSWKFAAEEIAPSLRHTKEVIGAYVITGARIHLDR
jgi:hypothetical protein